VLSVLFFSFLIPTLYFLLLAGSTSSYVADVCCLKSDRHRIRELLILLSNVMQSSFAG
jgi:hypothetical protein